MAGIALYGSLMLATEPFGLGLAVTIAGVGRHCGRHEVAAAAAASLWPLPMKRGLAGAPC